MFSESIHCSNMKQRPNTIWDIIKPYYRILKFFGLAVFSVKGKVVDGNIQSRPIEVLHFFFVLSIQIYVLYINIALDLSLSRTNSFLIDKGAHGIEIFNGINVVLGSCLYVFYRKRIWRIFRKCHEFDEEVSSLCDALTANAQFVSTDDKIRSLCQRKWKE